MAIAPEAVRQAEYYRLDPRLKGEKKDGQNVPEFSQGSDFSKLLADCLKPIKHSKLRIFPPQGEPTSPNKDAKGLEREAAEVLYFYTKDIFDQEGKVKAGQEQTRDNLKQLVPKVLEILISDDNKVDGVQKSQTLNTLAASLQMVRDPKSQLAFEVGIGGATVDFTSARFLVYGLGALKTAEALHALYNGETSRVLINEAVKKRITVEQEKGEVDRPRKTQIRTEIGELYKTEGEQGLIDTNILDPSEIDALKDRYAISTNLPVVKFVFTPQAALFVNFKGQEQAVLDNAERNKTAIKSFIEKGSPISDYVYYLTDIPWKDHAPETRLSLDYLTKVIQDSQDPAVTQEREKIQQMGYKHGGEQGAKDSDKYAAMHKLAFEAPGGMPNSPYMEYPDQQTRRAESADIVVTRGCRRERTFNILMEGMRDESRAEGFESFLFIQLAAAETDQRRNEIGQTLVWLRESVSQSRLIPDRPFRTRVGVSMLDVTASHAPGYYADSEDWDIRDHNIDLVDKIEEIRGNLSQGRYQRERRPQIESMIEDLAFLHDELKRRELTLAMVA